MTNAMDQAQGAIANSTSVAFSSIWEDNEATNEGDLVRNDAQASDAEKETEKEYEHTGEEANDNIEYEIQSIEDEVNALEKFNYPEETESEEEIKNKEIRFTTIRYDLRLEDTIYDENNEIVR